jgi:hypothetical protein
MITPILKVKIFVSTNMAAAPNAVASADDAARHRVNHAVRNRASNASPPARMGVVFLVGMKTSAA